MRVAAVMVAYNRAELLREALTALGQQTRPVDEVIVVDNASTDGSTQVAAEMVARFGGNARLIALTENTGGAGGFATGIAAAVSDPTIEWVWVMDDDTVPTPTVLAEALAAHERYVAAGNEPDDLGVMGSRVVWTDGDDHPMNTPKPKIAAGLVERQRAAEAGAMEIRSISFVSAFLRAELVRLAGLPLADYFLWNDDFEFSARLLKRSKGLYVPDSVVVHKTKIRGSSDQDPGERFYFEVRNKLWVFLYSNALKPWEKVAYFGASIRRWVRTFGASGDRAVLLRCLVKGLRDGLRAGPRATSHVLAHTGAPQDVEAAILQYSQDTVARRDTSEAPQHRLGSIVNLPAKVRRTDGFSLLLPVYAGDDPAHLQLAFDSSVTDQTLRPSEVVVVQDGPVGEALGAQLKHFEQQSKQTSIPVRVVRLPENVGLTTALNAGLAQVSYEVVARMDADDVSLPDRFERQWALMSEGFDLVGTGMVEFDDDHVVIGASRVPPVGGARIREHARTHNPFNHPTMMYRVSAIELIGGYQPFGKMEDYWLGVRMIASGARVENIADALVKYRVGSGAFHRRGGWQEANTEVRLQRAMLKMGFISWSEFFRNVLMKGLYRLLPATVKRVLFRRFVGAGLPGDR